jgi:hypothetical protein
MQLLHRALRPDGHFILAEPNRPIARDFFRLLRDHRFQYMRATERVEVNGEVTEVSIYHGARKQASHDHRH